MGLATQHTHINENIYFFEIFPNFKNLNYKLTHFSVRVSNSQGESMQESSLLSCANINSMHRQLKKKLSS